MMRVIPLGTALASMHAPSVSDATTLQRIRVLLEGVSYPRDVCKAIASGSKRCMALP